MFDDSPADDNDRSYDGSERPPDDEDEGAFICTRTDVHKRVVGEGWTS